MAKVRLPRTSTRRGDLMMLTLIQRIQPLSWHPMGIKGKRFKCGIEIEVEKLWPSPDYPRVPVLLEFAGIAVAGWGHKRSSHWYVLWQYDEEEKAFVELLRVAAYGIEWYETIRIRALEALRDPERSSGRQAAWAAKRVEALVEEEYQSLDGEGQRHFLSRLYEAAEARITCFE